MMRMQKVLAVLLLMACFTFNYAYTAPAFLDIDRVVRIGLESLGKHKSIKLMPSNKYVEIFDPQKKRAVYTGKATSIKVSYVKKGHIKIEIDGQKNLLNLKGEMLFSPVGRPPNYMSIKAGYKKQRSYRGSIAIYPQDNRLVSVNQVDLEDYLKSVVPSEIFNNGPAPTLEAQAIAARTYAVRNINRHRKKNAYDLCDKVHCQVYSGMVREYKTTTAAVNNTPGRVLAFKDELANTVYHANCGGILICSTAAWGGRKVPYLVSHRDGIKGQELFCSLGYKIKRRKDKNLKLPKPVKNLIVKSFPANTKKRYHKNFGHRVGMCQDGAIGMGAIGYTHRQILAFYYPGTALATLKYAIPSRKNLEQPPQPKPIVIAMQPVEDKNLTPDVLEFSRNPTQTAEILRVKDSGNSAASVIQSLREVSKVSKEKSGGLKKVFWNSASPDISKQPPTISVTEEEQ